MRASGYEIALCPYPDRTAGRLHPGDAVRQADRDQPQRQCEAGGRRASAEGRAGLHRQQSGVIPEMTRQAKIIATLAASLLLTVGATRALAADPAVESALQSGVIGEQWDGYLGFVRPPSPDVK